MKLDLKALTITAAIGWGCCFLLVGIANLIWPSYGTALLNFGASIYPGYSGPSGFGSVIVLTLYAALDGAVCGAVLAWLYNTFAGKGGGAAA